MAPFLGWAYLLTRRPKGPLTHDRPYWANLFVLFVGFWRPKRGAFYAFFLMCCVRPSGVCCALFMCSLIYLVAGAFASGCGCGRTHR